MRHLQLFSLLFGLLIARLAIAEEHIIEPGDTISGIAHRYAVTQNDLKQLNGIKSDTKLQLGDILIIPQKLIGNSRRSHTVSKGDTVARIASKYKVTQDALRQLNRLGPNEVLQTGRILAIPNPPGDEGPSYDPQGHFTDKISDTKPRWAGGIVGLAVSGQHAGNGILHTVLPGQTLAMISRAYVIDLTKIAKANSLSAKTALKPGTELLIPGAKRPVPVRTNQYKPHSIQFVRVKKTQKMKIKLLRPNGIVRPQGRKALGTLMGYRRMHPELANLLQRVAERFPGKQIEILSGYRAPVKGKRKPSMHARGRAVDFRIPGVSNELLYEFIASLDNVGAGYYPNSLHVHLDTRDKKYLWTDVSGRGEQAIYVAPGEAGHFSTIADAITDDGEVTDNLNGEVVDSIGDSPEE